MQLNQLSVFHC